MGFIDKNFTRKIDQAKYGVEDTIDALVFEVNRLEDVVEELENKIKELEEK